MTKMQIYDALRECPQNAQKPIQAGRLRGMTDVNPMWRIKALTEVFGACGNGWKYEITNKWLEHGASGEIAAFVDIALYYKDGDKWSDPIPGTGGSMFITNEKNGLHTDDECFKKALTDAISVAAKALGCAANVYWANDRTKYTQAAHTEPPKCSKCGKPISGSTNSEGKTFSPEQVAQYTGGLCKACFDVGKQT